MSSDSWVGREGEAIEESRCELRMKLELSLYWEGSQEVNK